ncbi:MAG: hypothetical protein KBC57_12510 [Neisseriaceae bacterium]|nr:hypothetical protein [Neisseriaceae bacterium]MBP6863161.1 hypothetical protein [Neisseriaceae bacterium]
MGYLIALIAGLLFGLGLLLSGMANPAVVQGFLDPFGHWRPEMAVAMVGALGLSGLGVYLAKKRSRTWTGEALSLPKNGPIDRRLVMGGLLFGVGWGLAGICPGPAVILVSRGVWQGLVFAAAMLIGMGLFHLYTKYKH